MLIIREALSGYRRFEDFRERLGIARNILTRRLRHLEAHGILERVQYQDRPPRYEYVLTQKGKELGVALMALTQWGNKWKTAGDKPAPITFSSAISGAPLEVRIIDTATDESVYYKSVVVTPADGVARHPGKDDPA